jgi:hypothetical protein
MKAQESKLIRFILISVAQQSQISNKMCRTMNLLSQYEGIELLLQSKLNVKNKKNVTWRKSGYIY